VTGARRLLLAVLVAAASSAAVAARAADPSAPAPAGAGDSTLRFLRDGDVVTQLDRAALEHACAVQTVQIDDPYYRTRKSFRACPLRRVLELGFGEDALAHPDDEIFLRARDGYVKTATAKLLAQDGGYLAIADADHARDGDPGWQPIDRRQVDPGPYYLVWAKPEQRDAHRYPWPYQLVAIEITDFAREYPHTVPSKAKRDTPPWRGFAIFRDECVSCHAINGEGGKIGPDLNVPRSIVEYRPAAQIKAYIRDPESFRHTSMPAHPHLKPGDLDALIAYFGVMKTMKHDPGRTQ
jgi:mono/diheme cytochrome c family protein